MTLCNMAVEAGATSGICQPDETTVEYLWPFIKGEYPSKKKALEDFSQWKSDPDAEYEQVITFDVSTLEPLVTFGYKPDQVKPVREMTGTRVDQVYIGSCTNGRYEDLEVAASVLKGKKIHRTSGEFWLLRLRKCTGKPSRQGFLKDFLDAGFCVTNPTCGACLGMSNGVLAPGEVCASTTNRNFNGRMGKGGMIHLMSPATAAATALAGVITNSPLYAR